jgi:hypothetical protein
MISAVTPAKMPICAPFDDVVKGVHPELGKKGV